MAAYGEASLETYLPDFSLGLGGQNGGWVLLVQCQDSAASRSLCHLPLWSRLTINSSEDA